MNEQAEGLSTDCIQEWEIHERVVVQITTRCFTGLCHFFAKTSLGLGTLRQNEERLAESAGCRVGSYEAKNDQWRET